MGLVSIYCVEKCVQFVLGLRDDTFDAVTECSQLRPADGNQKSIDVFFRIRLRCKLPDAGYGMLEPPLPIAFFSSRTSIKAPDPEIPG